MTYPQTFEEAEARLAESLPDYEARTQQQTLARAVEDAISNGVHLLAEAGTGTGKSLGYLIPAILSGQRVIVSTATKALQDQIANKDLPFLHTHLGVYFSYAILKGRSNYICGNKATDPQDDIPSLSRILRTLTERGEDETFKGEREDFDFEIPYKDWAQLASNSDDCRDCGPECYAYRARQIALSSQVVVVNHALYMTEMLVKDVSDGFASFLGPHDVVIFDEAHEIEDYASSSLGAAIRERGLINLIGEVSNFTQQYDQKRSQDAARITSQTRRAASNLWATLEEGRIRYADLEERADEFVDLANALVDLEEFMRPWNKKTSRSSTRQAKRGARVARDVELAADRFRKYVTDPFSDTVRWVEKEIKRGQEQLNLMYAPVDVSPYLRRMIFESDVTAIMVSATLAVNGKMDYIAKRVGVDSFTSLDVGTPFDYPTQAQLYVPVELPDPGKERTAWSSRSIHRMKELVELSGGRALLLFTSVKEMRAAYEMISPMLPYRCMMQGEDNNKNLAATFKEDETSVLFATKSFMTGVDFAGDTLRLVVINKLPFPVPTDPITEARCENIKARGGSDFFEYSVPVMTLILKQAFGRLIRHRNDRGVVAILDPRLETKGYGRGIIKSLPDAPLVTTLSQVEAMMNGGPA